MSSSTPEKKTIEKPLLDQARQQKAREYSRIHRRLAYLEMGLSLALLLVLVLTGFSSWFTGLFHWPLTATAVVYFLILLVGYGVLTFPLSYYSGFILPHRYGIATQKLRGWLADLFKREALGLGLGAAAVAVIYWFLLNFPDWWWLMAWGTILIVSIVLSIITPVLLVPLFYKMKPLADTELRSRLERLAQKAGAKIHGIFVLDFSAKGTTANAGLMGMGRTRRIVVSDTLIQNYSTPEIEVVTAHEIGHHMDRDIYRLTMFQSAVYLLMLKIVDVVLQATLAPLGSGSPGDPAALPWLLFLFGALSALASPLTNSYTRLVEGQADGYALNLTDDPQAFIDSMTRLVNQNLGVAHPSKWEEFLFYDHPSYNKRVEHARRYERERDRDIHRKEQP